MAFETPVQLGAPPDVVAPFISHLGYHDLLNSEKALAPSAATSGDALRALDWLPFTKWESTNGGDRSFVVDLDWDEENWLLYSETIDNAAWTKADTTVTANAVAAPDGTTTADKLVETATTAEHIAHQSISKAAASQAWTLDVFLKSGGRTFAGIRLDDGAGNGYRLDVNLTTGAVGTPVAIGTGYTVTNSSSTDAGGGWWRVRLSVTTNSAGTLRALVQPETALGTVSYLGVVTDGIHVWGAQMVKSASQKPYAVTVASARIPPASPSNPIDTPLLYTANYGAVYAYALGGGTLYLDYWNADTFAYVNFLTFTPSELTGAPVMKIAGAALVSYRWRIRMVGVPENRLLHSEAFDNAAWAKTDTTITPNNIDAPDGEFTADLLTEGAAGTALVQQDVAGFTAGATVELSIYLKRGNHDWVQIMVSDTAPSDVFRAWFNLATGVAGTGDAAVNGTYLAHGIESVGDGWYRCFVRGIVDTNSTTLRVRTQSATADASATKVANSTRYQWGAQIEQSALAPSAYMMTTTAAVTFTALLGVVSIGQWLGFPQQQVGWTPARLARRTKLQSNISDAGQFLGRSVIRQAWNFDITARLLDLDWAYDALPCFFRHIEKHPFFFKWDSGDPGVADTAFCWLDSNDGPQAPTSTPYRVDVNLPVAAIVEAP